MMSKDYNNIIQLINSQKDNFPLDQLFYVDKSIYELDLETFFYNQWIFVGHQSRIPNKGDYFIFSIGNESIIIIRESESQINCFYNVCRHRGSQICLETEGNSKKLVCPYHAWTYNLDGKLKNARMMYEDFDKKNGVLLNAIRKFFKD